MKKKEDEKAAELAELQGKYQMALADFDNFRKQAETKQAQVRVQAAEATVLKFLPILDDIFRAFAASPETLEPVAKTLEKTMSELALERIPAAAGEPFDPELHNALSVEGGEGEREVIAEELLPGYKYEGNVIRAAMVKVRKEAK